jgi:flavin reductase (DIM6/NTAB) family NADH-FMN oxidoreductase RutF
MCDNGKEFRQSCHCYWINPLGRPSQKTMKEKVSLSLDKRNWQPSPLLGQVVLVTSLNEDGQSNVAPKSWLSMMAFEPSLLALGCNLAQWTAQNILHRQEFVVNVPGDDLADIVWKSHSLPHPRHVEHIGLTSIPAQKVKPPLITECKAHLECTYVQHLTFGEEIILLGQIVAASIDRAAVEAHDPYEYLRLFTFLEGETIGVIEKAHRMGESGTFE